MNWAAVAVTLGVIGFMLVIVVLLVAAWDASLGDKWWKALAFALTAVLGFALMVGFLIGQMS